MKYLVFLLVMLGFSFATQAQKGQSIMFGDQDPMYTEKTADTAADEHAELCKKLKQQMKDLEGKPLRRNPVVRRHQEECMDMHNSFEK
ncbi:MAG: hypothetical protein QNK19_12565 [Xanthomonadales bacterium]|nr:hypothetical protein [Xanthomonadales bacterium]